MSLCVIMNPNAGSAHQQSVLIDLIRQHPSAALWETKEGGEARMLAAEAAERGYDIVVAAGGDGTIHEVANGLVEGGAGPKLGILPLGTGNDLVRTLDIPLDPIEAFALLGKGQTRPIDLIRVDAEGTHRYVINAAAGGFSGQVDEAISSDLKRRWGPLAFILGAVSVLPDLTGYETTVSFDGDAEERVDVVNVIVANGRTVGGGKRVAPLANPEDGLMDVVLVERAPVLQLGGVAARLLTGNYLESDLVRHRQVKEFRVVSRPGMWFNVDGELLTKEPITFKVAPAAIDIIVGEGYTAVPVAG